MENTGEDQPQTRALTPEERLKLFNYVNEMLKGAQLDKAIGVDNAGRMDSKQTAELIDKLQTLDLATAQIGDVVWWKTKNSNNYFLVGSSTEGKLTGSFKSFRNDGQDGRSYEIAHLLGAGIPDSIIVTGVIKQNLPVEMSIPKETTEEPSPPKKYLSSSVQDMGIIQGSEITPIP